MIDNIPTFKTLSLGKVWDSIDVNLKAHGNNIEKIYMINPGANISDIKMKIDAGALSISENGEMIISTEMGKISMTAPIAFQIIDGKRNDVSISYVIDGINYGFLVGKYDHSKLLVIDPLLASTFLGNISQTYSKSIALDGAGNVYVTGWTSASDFPTTAGAYDTTPGLNFSTDVFVSKLNPDLSILLASTFIGGANGGQNGEGGNAIALDGAGNVYVTGWTSASDFPTTAGAYDTTFSIIGFSNTPNVFVSKLNPDLSILLASTFIGGALHASDGQGNSEIALDGAGNVYVAGITSASDFPTTAGAYDTTYDSDSDVFVSKLNSDLSILLASTFIGGEDKDTVHAITLDGSGNVYITGITSGCYPCINPATQIPTTLHYYPTTLGAYDRTIGGDLIFSNDVFVSKINPDLSILLASTFIGGVGGFDAASDIALDGAGNVYVAGITSASDFPTTAGAYDTTYNVDSSSTDTIDFFVSKLNGDLSLLSASTFLGGGFDDDSGQPSVGIALDGSNNVYVTGTTISSDFPTTAGAYDTTYNGNHDVFVSMLNGDLSLLSASTFLGGSHGDGYSGEIALDGSNNVYVAGDTASSDFPTTAGAYDTMTSQTTEGITFVSKFDNLGTPSGPVKPAHTDLNPHFPLLNYCKSHPQSYFCLPTPDHCKLNPQSSSCQNQNIMEFDQCISPTGKLICKVNLNILKKADQCLNKIDGPCYLPKTLTKHFLLEIQQQYPPLKQIKSGIDLKDIVPAEGKVLIINDHRVMPISVKESTAKILLSKMDMDWHNFP